VTRLAAWQDDLVDALTTRSSPAAITTTPGFQLTRRVQREWRSFRIRSSLPLTCRLLGAAVDAEIEAYLDAVVEPSSFFLREAEQFAAHCHAGRLDDNVAAVLRFELAMLRAVQERAAGRPLDAPPRRHDLVGVRRAADVIPFGAPPEQVLLAAVTGDPPPRASGRYLLLCTPRVCRPATAAEGAAFDLARHAPRPAAAFDAAVLESLAAAGAIVSAGGE
jgi:hypothetical protein